MENVELFDGLKIDENATALADTTSMMERIEPRFQQFQRVLITAGNGDRSQFRGEAGTILWRDWFCGGRRRPPATWTYSVRLPASDCCPTFIESDLQSVGTFDDRAIHLGVRPEISFDRVMDEDMTDVEGTYRLPGEFWQVLVFAKANVPTLRRRPQRWQSGMTGIAFRVPRTVKLMRPYVLCAMSRAFSVPEWTEVRGPDSMVLR